MRKLMCERDSRRLLKLEQQYRGGVFSTADLVQEGLAEHLTARPVRSEHLVVQVEHVIAVGHLIGVIVVVYELVGLSDVLGAEGYVVEAL